MATNYFGEDSSWRLWPDSAPREDLVFEVPAPAQDAVIGDVFRPRVFLFRAEKPNGSAALVLAGGGYTKLVIGKEGVEVARWFNTLGMHAFVLAHRFPGRSGSQAPVDDAIEAMRQVRARAGEWGVDPDKVGVCGLSSGGHLASCLIARYPDVIFPRLFRFIFGWIVPVIIVANIPARLLIKPLSHPEMLMFHLVFAGSIAFALSRMFWRFALRHYSSASS